MERHRLDQVDAPLAGGDERALGEAFGPFLGGVRIGDHARPQPQPRRLVATRHLERADRDVEDRVAFGADPADRAGISAAGGSRTEGRRVGKAWGRTGSPRGVPETKKKE